MKPKKSESDSVQQGNGAHTGYHKSVLRTFAKSFDTGVSIFLEYRTDTSVREYEVPQVQNSMFDEYEVTGSMVGTKNNKSMAAGIHQYPADLASSSFFVEPFEETTVLKKESCKGLPEQPQKEELIPMAAQQSAHQPLVNGVNKEANHLLHALSAIETAQAHQGADGMNDSFIEDMKTILTDPKSLKKEMPPAPVQQQTVPAPSTEEDIFARIARNMQYANQYDFGTMDLQKRFDEFDKSADLQLYRPSEIKVRAGNDRIEKLVTQQAFDPGPADFLKDLDLIATASAASVVKDKREEVIPLDPGIGGRSILPTALQAGDVILSTTSDDRISKAIRDATHSQISHASIYVGQGHVIHSTETGVDKWSLGDLMNSSSLCVAYHHRDMDQAKAGSIVQFLENAKANNKGFDSWGLLYAAPAQLLATYCDSMTGTAREACLHGARNIKPGTDDSDRFYCSELVFAAFKQAGLSISTIDPSFSSPQDAVRLFHDGTLQYVGHLKV